MRHECWFNSLKLISFIVSHSFSKAIYRVLKARHQTYLQWASKLTLEQLQTAFLFLRVPEQGVQEGSTTGDSGDRAACDGQSCAGHGLPREYQSCCYRLNGYGHGASTSIGPQLWDCPKLLQLRMVPAKTLLSNVSIFWCSKTGQGLFPVSSVHETTFLQHSPAPKAALMLSVGMSRHKETFLVSFSVCSFFPNLLHRKGRLSRTLTFFESLLSLRAHDLTLGGARSDTDPTKVCTYCHCQKSVHLCQLLFLTCS